LLAWLFSGVPSVEDLTDGVADGVGRSPCSLAKPVFELGEELLDRVQIGGVCRQEEKPGACGTDGAAHSVALVRTKIVHDHDVAGLQCRNKNLGDIETEACLPSIWCRTLRIIRKSSDHLIQWRREEATP
jgi:hypothetical protein